MGYDQAVLLNHQAIAPSQSAELLDMQTGPWLSVPATAFEAAPVMQKLREVTSHSLVVCMTGFVVVLLPFLFKGFFGSGLRECRNHASGSLDKQPTSLVSMCGSRPEAHGGSNAAARALPSCSRSTPSIESNKSYRGRIHMCDFLAQQTPLDSPNAQRAGL